MARRSRGRNKAALFGTILSLSALAPVPAFADDLGVSMLLYGFGAAGKIRGATLGVGDDTFEPEPLRGKNLTLDGSGIFAGGGMQATVTIHGVRLGFGGAFFGLEDTRFRHDPLPDGMTLVSTTPWGARIDGFLGYELLQGRVRPYVDIVASGSFVGVDVDLRHPVLGDLARTSYSTGAFGLGPRGGLSIGLSRHAFADVSATYSVFGHDRLRVMAGIGIRSN